MSDFVEHESHNLFGKESASRGSWSTLKGPGQQSCPIDMLQVNIDQGGSFSVCILLRLDPVALSWSRYQFLFVAYFPRSYFAFRFGSNDFGGTAFTWMPTSIMHTSRKWCLVSTKHMVLQE